MNISKDNGDLKAKVENSIRRIQTFAPKEGYYLAFSGGKDSCVCKALCDMAGVKYDAHYRVTGIDPPELVNFIKKYHSDVSMEVPRDSDGRPITMWNLIERKLMPPTRRVRYCCEYLKEDGGDGRMVITGVRWAESNARKLNHGIVSIRTKDRSFDGHEDFKTNPKGGVVLINDNEESRRMIERCYRASKTTLNPIIDWEDRDVWDFIKEYEIPYCSLYEEGFQRLGCIGCPLSTYKNRSKEFARWPKYKNAYMLAFYKMLIARKEKGKENNKWKCAEDVFHWWMEDGVMPGQYNLFDIEEET